MIKSFFVPVVVILFVTFASAQTRYGVITGMNISSFSGKDSKITGMDLFGVPIAVNGPNMRTGYALGAFLDARLTEKLSLSPEFQYSQKGAVYDFSGQSTSGPMTGELTYKYHYMDLTLPLKYVPKVQGNPRTVVMAGPSCGFLVASKASFVAAAGKESVDEEIPLAYQTTVDLGIMAGAGFRFFFGAHEAEVTVRYEYGFTTVDDAPTDPIELTNSSIQLRAAFLY